MKESKSERDLVKKINFGFDLVRQLQNYGNEFGHSK